MFPLSNCCYLWKELKIAYIVESPVKYDTAVKKDIR